MAPPGGPKWGSGTDTPTTRMQVERLLLLLLLLLIVAKLCPTLL